MTSLKSMIDAALAALDAGDVDAARRTLADTSAYWTRWANPLPLARWLWWSAILRSRRCGCPSGKANG